MRERISRGKRTDNGEWVYGFLYEHHPPLQCIVPKDYVPEQSKWYILKTAFADWNMPRQVEFVEVDPETVGDYTGVPDKAGVKIFEGDIVKMLSYHGGYHNAEIYFKSGKFAVNGSHYHFKDICSRSVEVIGNIYDNPELIKEENK